jgi:hypothetical protein
MNYAQAVSDALDQLDRTPFGDMEKALDKIADLALKASLERGCMVQVLQESRLQIEYLHSIFRETGSGNTVLAKIQDVLNGLSGIKEF